MDTATVWPATGLMEAAQAEFTLCAWWDKAGHLNLGIRDGQTFYGPVLVTVPYQELKPLWVRYQTVLPTKAPDVLHEINALLGGALDDVLMEMQL